MHNGLRTLLTLVALAAPALAQALAGAAPARSAPAARPAEPTIKLRVAHVYDENYPWQKAHERFREIVRTRTRGTVDVQIFPNATLGTEKDYVSYLRQGVLDIATVSTAAAGDLVPEVAFFDLM